MGLAMSMRQQKDTENRPDPFRFWHMRFWHGMKFSTWIALLARNRFQVAPRRLGLAVTITLTSIANSALRVLQEVVLYPFIRHARIEEPPIFVLGHWRSGTTMLHEVMVLDERFTCPNTYQCMAPNHFLLTSWIALRLTFLLPKKRPMDEMAAGWKQPQEDEFALVNLGQPSPYSSIAFPNGENSQGALSLEGLSKKQKQSWKQTLFWFLKRVSAQSKNRLVVKSPTHTARVKTLLEMFPEAKFIFVVRDPYEVFLSTMKLWTALRQSQSLQTGDNHDLKGQVLSDFETMFEAFKRDRSLIPEGHLFETRFEDFVDSPVSEMERLYGELGLGGFERSRPAIESYFARRADFQRDRYSLTPELREEIDRRWGPYMRRYGYKVSSERAGTG